MVDKTLIVEADPERGTQMARALFPDDFRSRCEFAHSNQQARLLLVENATIRQVVFNGMKMDREDAKGAIDRALGKTAPR